MLHSPRHKSVKIPNSPQFSVFNSLLSKEIIFPAATLYRRLSNTMINSMIFGYFILALLVLALPTETFAREYESVENIRSVVQQYMRNKLVADKDSDFEIGHIDQRLKLDRCDQPLKVSDSGNSRFIGHNSLAVRCTGHKMWKIYVPVTILRYTEVLVMKQNQPRGSLLQESDVELRRLDISRLSNGYFTDKKEVQGKILKRSLRRGDILTSGALDVKKLVRRGDIVTIMASSNTLAIRVKGQALMDGRKGDVIRVKNHSSKREIQAVVVATGKVKVSM